MSAQNSAVAKVGDARNCRKELKDAKEIEDVTQITASKARDDAKKVIKEPSKFEPDLLAKVVRGRDEIAELTNYLRQRVASAAVESKELAAVHAELDLDKEKVYSLNGALKVSRKEIAAIKGVVEKQRVRLNAAGTRPAELKIRRNEASALTVTCR